MNDKTSSRNLRPTKFGTFGGVFTPSLLTILGVIMFLRFSTVVGYAGLWNALMILGGGTAISLITGLSIASVATNMRVRGGGAYYLISRSLGAEFGGVIAIFFFIAQAIAVTLYIVGFTEAILSFLPGTALSPGTIGTITNIAVFLCVYIGAGWTIRVQYVILAVLFLSVLSFFIGAGATFSPQILRANLDPQWAGDHSLFTVFALFFPAVTGIMAGVNMSGDLNDPGRSIPRGTLAAIGVSTLIYAVMTVLLAGGVQRAELLGPGFVVKDHAFSPVLIYAGVISATLSSALGSMMGAPRILQALARDDIFRGLRWFARGSGPSAEPRRAIIITAVIAQIGILAGDLDTVAPVITMFFLMTYATVNLACFFEGRSNNPSFRPTFRFNHWSVALLGALGCFGVMFLINTIWASVALILGGIFFFLIARAEVKVKWGDLYSGLAYQAARRALLRLERERYHPKNWRPSILALSGGAHNRLHLAQYARWCTANSGIVSIAQLIRGNLSDLVDHRREAETILRRFILKERIPAFPVVIVEENIHAAIKALLQCQGIGGMRPNTVLLGMSRDPEKADVFYETINTVKEMGRSLIIVASHLGQEIVDVPEGAINIWWDSSGNVELMLLLAFMMTRNREWSDHTIRIIRPVSPKADLDNITREMREMLSRARIDAEIVIVPTQDPLDGVRKNMQSSAVLFVGFDPAMVNTGERGLARTQAILDLPGDTVFVYNAGHVSIEA